MSFSAIGLTTENISSFRDLDSGWITLAAASLGRRAAYKQTGAGAFPDPLFMCASSPVCSSDKALRIGLRAKQVAFPGCDKQGWY